MDTTITIDNFDFTLSDNDVVNPTDYIPKWVFNPYYVRPWLLHDHGFPVAIVFASCPQDALDAAADVGKLDGFRVIGAKLADYGDDEEGITLLGNASEPFDIESVGVLELPNPPLSFCALLKAAMSTEEVTR
jgi:hypothetical protein